VVVISEKDRIKFGGNRNPEVMVGDFVNFISSTPKTLTNTTIDDYTNHVHADAIHIRVKNADAVPINIGQPVKITGYNVGQSATEVVLANQATGVSNGLFAHSEGADPDILAVGDFGLIISTGILKDFDTSSFSEGAILYVDGTGTLTATEPTTGFAQPIAYVLRSNANNGAVQINADYPKQDASDVRFTPSGRITSDNVNDALIELDENMSNVFDDTFEPTGFTDPSSITVSYDSTTRKVTLTGTVKAYWRGAVVTALTNGWVSDAHDNTTGTWYLYYNGTSFVWSSTVWTFDKLMIAFVNYGTSDKFGVREPHSLMNWHSHQEFHKTIGTYLDTGGDLASYTLNSTTAGDRRPTVSETLIRDEDIPTTNATLTNDLFTQCYLTSSGTTSFTVDASDIVPLSASQPYYNQFTGGSWQQTLMSVNNYQAIWLVAIPVTSDSASQKYRFIWIQGQSQSATLSVIQGLAPSSLNTGTLPSISTEFVFIAKVIIRYTAGNWQLIQVDKLTGSKFNQTAVANGNYLSTVTTNSTLTGSGTASDPLGTVIVLSINNMIESPSNKTYILEQYAKVAKTINDLTIINVSGTCTVAIKINGTDVTSLSSVSVSSVETTATATGANTVAVGDTVSLVVSSNSASVDMAFSLQYTL
jgi:hypothetical protein